MSIASASPCNECEQEDHTGLLDVSAPLPHPIAALSKAQRFLRAKIRGDFCSLGSRQFFVRGVLPMPIRGTALRLRYAVWAAVSERTARALAAPSGLESRAPGRLATAEPFGSLGYPLAIEPPLPGELPTFHLAPSSERLYDNQVAGIDYALLHFYRRRVGLEVARNTAAQWPLWCGEDHSDWAFTVPATSGVFVGPDVANGARALMIAHTPGGLEAVAEPSDPSDASFICLGCLLRADPTLVKLCELTCGWQATRGSPDEPWQESPDE